MRKAVILAAALLAGACTNAVRTETADEIRIHFGAGGFVGPKWQEYAEYGQSGKQLVIDGQIISADAFYAFSIGQGCYTRKIVFSPHAASYFGLIPSRRITRDLATYLPKPLREWFRHDISYHDWIGFAELTYDDMKRLWPEGECPPEHA